MQKHGLDAGQIAFRREMRANFGSRMAEEYAEDAESCFMASGECVFDVEVIDRRMREPRNIVEQRENGRLLVFFPPITGENGATPKEYIIGVDPAGGGSDGDYACAQVIERGSGMQCAELQGHFAPAELAARVAMIGREYNNALIAVERNNHGHGVLAHLALHEGVPNVYYQAGQTGWLTSAASRPRMLENVCGDADECAVPVQQHAAAGGVPDVCAASGWKCSAANGTHDDLVMAMAVALAVRAEVAANARHGRRSWMSAWGSGLMRDLDARRSGARDVCQRLPGGRTSLIEYPGKRHGRSS